MSEREAECVTAESPDGSYFSMVFEREIDHAFARLMSEHMRNTGMCGWPTQECERAEEEATE